MQPETRLGYVSARPCQLENAGGRMFDYEKLGAFYLGREASGGEGAAVPVLYDARDLTTHAVIVGMTGSGKTGLGVALLEEAAIDGIPALVIDPKGDMGNLLLRFPKLRAQDFAPWVDAGEATRAGMSPEEFAAQQATRWKQGLAEWDQAPDRIKRLQESSEAVVYTPGSSAGWPVSLLKSLDAPTAAVRADAEAFAEHIGTTVSGILTLLGIDADPLRSREHVFLSRLLEHAWQEGRSLSLGELIREIQTPPFSRIGLMDLESVMPASDRMRLAMTLNNLLASPAFAGWLQGEPLNLQRMLYSADGRPRLAVVSIAHLSEQERMFFVSLLLGEVISWMRGQPGTSSLRAVIYMDEVFGYLPPTANPPSKKPLLTLLKQARAYGVGLVLATQNPVDLDYKALSNAGTWFLGRLQTERDKARVLDGLEGASTASGAAFERSEVDRILSGLKSRTFLLHNVHEDVPVLMETRWVLSYLRGPLTREQISKLMENRRASHPQAGVVERLSAPSGPGTDEGIEPSAQLPAIPAEISQRYFAGRENRAAGIPVTLRPALLAVARLRFADSKSKVDVWQETALLLPVDGEGVPDALWEEAEECQPSELDEISPPAQARYAALPAECLRATSYRKWSSALKAYLYREKSLKLYYAPKFKLYSSPGDRQADFEAQLQLQAREQRDREVEKLRRRHASAADKLLERIRKAEQRVEVERQQANSATLSAAVTFGTSVLSALFGRKKISSTNVGRAATSMRAASRAADQRSDIQRAEANVQSLQEEFQALEAQLQADVEKIAAEFQAATEEVEEYPVRPRKSDLTVEQLCLAWIPREIVGQ